MNSFEDAEVSVAVSDGESRPHGVVVVCGSAFIMSDARLELGVNEPRDSEELFFDLSKPKVT